MFIPLQLKSAVKKFLESSSLSFLRQYYSGLGTCLLYHRVEKGNKKTNYRHPFSGLVVSEESFEEQVQYFSENFNCLDLPTAIDLLQKGDLPQKTLILTFDDGYKDNKDVALPILERYGVPATIYIPCGLIDGSTDLWWYEQEFILHRISSLDLWWRGIRLKYTLLSQAQKHRALSDLNLLFKSLTPQKQAQFMKTLRDQCPAKYSYDNQMLSWEEIVTLDKHPLITIGAHTISHPVLARLSNHELLRELKDSKTVLEEKLGHAVEHFAYPFGSLNEAGKRESKAVMECGYKSAVTTRIGHIHGAHKNRLSLIPRILIDYNDTPQSLEWKLTGITAMLSQRARRVAP
jgi:peptidoglycan/xylan/chitin deacetylase (PgdA/CDA1 family)